MLQLTKISKFTNIFLMGSVHVSEDPVKSFPFLESNLQTHFGKLDCCMTA
jgi:hypothetical protein